MINSVEVNNLITERKNLHPDDPKINDIWEQLIKIFSKDEHYTVQYLNNCSEDNLEWISEVFEDISKNLQSEKFIDELNLLNLKFPNLDLEMDISYAKKSLRN
ncbi:hypothetical protein IA759_08060 [Listeria marthii]|uniref:Uncharacterized protein n=3 Tax=Listeria TaxID=1637 RepID=A0ABU2IKF2_9LIST|nr:MULTISPECIES: hypothetical protein [Listeria]MBC2038195.1 hypothetical protein [Listeria marthii]MBC2100950.1 hypothetical protein [Listeria marthii]MBC2120573.1 hypothetical protein [Listeria marthii]MBF2363168.1 hypothetical protein [Listeria marthii]MBF2394128.1 hypothetical protein [Listeria marthii]